MNSESHQLKSVRMDEICRLVTDGTHDSPKLQLTGVPFIKGKHISGGFVDFKNCDFISEDDHRKAILRSKPERGDILFSNIGSVGDAAYVGTCREFSIKNVALFKPDYAKVDSRYLYYVVISPEFRGELMSKRQGAAQPFFSLEMLRNHQVCYHEDIVTQRKIASILSAYDDLIENNQRRIKILEEMAQNLYREWFVKFRFPGHQNTRFIDSPLGQIPEGWEAKTIGNMTSYISRGISPTYDDSSSSLVINQKCIRDHKLDLGLARRHNSRIATDKNAQFGDILINSTGVGTLGRVAQVYTDISNITVDTHVSIVRPQNSEDIDYLGMALIDMESHFESLGAGATGQTELRRERISETEIILPPLGLRKGFSSMVEPLRKLGINLLAENTTLRRTRDLLLPKLISGEVDVSELDIAVPEEVVL